MNSQPLWKTTLAAALAAASVSGQEARPLVPVPEPLERINATLQQAQRQAEAALAAARAELGLVAPKLSDLLGGLAAEAGKLEQKAAEKAGDPSAAEAKKLLEQQQRLNQQIESIKEALRRDANAQDPASPEGRERARDGDDAVAMLREPPPQAEEALADAARAKDPAAQKKSLEAAAAADKQLAQTLKQLAEHYKNLEAGKEAESRPGLRKAEEELGIKQALDEQAALTQRLMELANKPPKEALADLERELAKNPEMRQELKEIAKGTLEAARQDLQQAAAAEKADRKSVV